MFIHSDYYKSQSMGGGGGAGEKGVGHHFHACKKGWAREGCTTLGVGHV
jgi:hypothetical protein